MLSKVLDLSNLWLPAEPDGRLTSVHLLVFPQALLEVTAQFSEAYTALGLKAKCGLSGRS